MNEQNFYELFGEIDPEIIAAADRPVPLRKKRGFIIALIAAVLAFAILLAPLAVAFTAVGGYVSFKGGIGPAINGAVDSVLDILDNTDAGGGMISEFLDVDWPGLADSVSPDGNVNWDAFFSALRGEKAEPSSDGNVYKSVKLSDGTVKIVEFISGSDQTVIEVPEKIGGATVTVIGEGAFKGNDFITHVSLPESVTKIEKSAFEDCSSLITIDLPDNLREIGANAFFECYALTGIDLPYTLHTLGSGAFASCTSLTHTVIPSTLSNWEPSSFFGSGLRRVEIAEGITEIPASAFRATQLQEIYIPGSVTVIDELAFAYCTQLAAITLNDGLENIERDAFANTALSSLIIPATVTSMGDICFAGCTKLQKVLFAGDAPEILHPTSSQQLSSPIFTVYTMLGAQGFTTSEWEGLVFALTPEITQPFITESGLFDIVPHYKSTILSGGFRQQGGEEVVLIDNYKDYQKYKAAYSGNQNDFEYDRSYFEYFSIVLIRVYHASSEQIVGLAGLATIDYYTTSSGITKTNEFDPVIMIDAGILNTDDIVQTYITAEVMKSDFSTLGEYRIHTYNLNPEGYPGTFPQVEPPIID